MGVKKWRGRAHKCPRFNEKREGADERAKAPPPLDLHKLVRAHARSSSDRARACALDAGAKRP